MTDEDAFQKALDEHPEDFQTRLVFADWLQEQGDPRAEGMRALGARGNHPKLYTGSDPHVWGFDLEGQFADDGDDLPSDWFSQLEPVHRVAHWSESIRTAFTRKAIEDAAALAFARLPPERRTELLAGKPEVKT